MDRMPNIDEIFASEGDEDKKVVSALSEATTDGGKEGNQENENERNETPSVAVLGDAVIPVEGQQTSAPAPAPAPPSVESNPNWHRRNVSWGINNTTVIDVPTNFEISPHGSRGHGRQSSDTSGLSGGGFGHDSTTMTIDDGSIRLPYDLSHRTASTGTSRGGEGRGRYHGRKLTEINLDDILRNNPVEAEAETILIRALEKREPSMRKLMVDFPPLSGPVLGNISDAVVEAMIKSDRTEQTREAESAGLSAATPIAATHSSELDDNDIKSALRSSTRSNYVGGGNGADSVPKSPKLTSRTAATTRGVGVRGNFHRRTQTMEQKLYGLSSAIDALHSQLDAEYDPAISYEIANNDTASPSGGEGLRFRANTWGGTAANEIPTNFAESSSSADALTKNASLLLPRKASARNLKSSNKKDDDYNAIGLADDHSVVRSNSSTASSVSNWRKLRDAVKDKHNAIHSKKSDDGSVMAMENNVVMKEEVSDEINDIEAGDNVHHDAGISSPQKDQKTTGGEHDDNSDQCSNEKPQRRFRFVPAGLMFEEWKFGREFKDYIDPIKGSIRLYIRLAICFLMIPAAGIAAILFYLAGNPPVGILANNGRPNSEGLLVNKDGDVVGSNVVSYSWWLLFICVRQIVTFSLAKLMEMIFIDFSSIRLGLTFKVFGAWTTLFIMQSKGWPFVVFWWGVLDFLILSGSHEFFHNWLYWQGTVELFNGSNPSGHIVDSEWYRRVLAVAICLAATTAVKRFSMGLFLGKQTFAQYSEKLATVMKKILLISQVGALAKDIERKFHSRQIRGSRGHNVRSNSVWSGDKLEDLMHDAGDESSVHSYPSEGLFGFNTQHSRTTPVIDPDDRHPLTGNLNATQKSRITQLLGAWEEPASLDKEVGPISVSSLLQFRRALACLNTDYPFGASFGYAATREECIVSSQEVFRRLLLRLEHSEVLNFEVLALLGVHADGSLDQQKLLELIKLFRPDRDGTLSILDFVKSVDKVYREIRLLRASVSNSTKIDLAFENIINGIYFAIAAAVVLGALGFDPLALFVSVSGVVLAFAFMIGSASSKYFEGLLFILVRRPYAIGDAIHISDPNGDTSFTGSAWWMVSDVTLFTTSVIFFYTNERASLSNGSLANSRIINSTRSVNAGLYSMLKFPIDVPYEKVQLFHQALEEYVRNRPREWLGMSTFRATRIEAAEGYIEYMVAMDHRESWAAWTTIKTSQAHYSEGSLHLMKSMLVPFLTAIVGISSFALEVAKKLGINYKSPPLPVNLSVTNGPVPSFPGDYGPPNMSDAMSDVPPSGGGLGAGYSQELRNLQAKFAPRNNFGDKMGTDGGSTIDA